MPTEESPLAQDLLSHYGVSIAEYHGRGNLTLKEGETLNCRFEAGQLAAGDVLLLCDFMSPIHSRLSISPDKFEGVTSEGLRIFAKGITGRNYLPDPPRDRSGCWAAFRLREMSVQMTKHNTRTSRAHFGVTNFEFTGTKTHRTNNFFHRILPLSLECTGIATELSIIPLRGYNAIMRRIKTLRDIDVTCEAVGDIPRDGAIAPLTEIVDNSCYLLSVARGTKVQWIYYDLYDEAGERIQRTHCSRITKPFCDLPIIDPTAPGRDKTKTFIEQTYPIYLETKVSWRLNSGTIDAYLDAKAEQDYLEMRGVKLAVAMEILKSVFLELPDSPVKECVVDEKDFRERLAPLISTAADSVLKYINVKRLYRDAICSNKKVEGLNRRSFAHILSKLCKHIDLQIEKPDIQLFIACRNSLVHDGTFCCESSKPEVQQKCKQLSSPLDEYYFLVSCLDRMFLKLLGYSGRYINWRLPGSPSKEEI